MHIKRIHEYKRQLAQHPRSDRPVQRNPRSADGRRAPRVKIFAGKAAASYHQAKLIIKLIHDVARVINSDPTVRNS